MSLASNIRQPYLSLVASISVILALVPLVAQERAINHQRPLQTELIAPLDAGRLHRGSAVFAKVKYGWSSPGCMLATGSTVVGYIADLEQRTKQNKGSSMTLVFDKADCNGHAATPVTLVVFAVIAQVTINDGSGMIDRDGLFGSTSARPMQAMGGGMSNGTAQPAPPPYAPSLDASIRNARKKEMPNVILAGQVVGLNKVTLTIGTGTDGGSVLSSPNRNLRLESTTALILMPKTALAIADKAASTTTEPDRTNDASNVINQPPATPTATVAPPAPPEPIDETEICSSACNTVTETSGATHASAFASLSAAPLGYTPHDKREFTAFNYESALTYLDASNLLFTFDLHKLRQRSGKAMRPESTRMIRAVVIDSSTQTVKRILDWQVPGEGEYLWRAGNDHILVHIGHQLRLFGPDLKPIRMISVPGELAWVAPSPDGGHFAIGLLHERHTAALHQQIFDATNIDPEEDIDVQVFDRDFNLLLSATQPSTMYAPVLTDSGEVLVHPAGRDRWQISELHWDGTRQLVAAINSRCHPAISTPLPERLFVVGCATSASLNWFRLLRLDGHTILKNRGSSQEIEQAARSTSSTEIAIRIARTYKSTTPGIAFHKTDLREQEISIYDASDGHRLFTTTADDIALTDQSFALSPPGRQIAVLRNSSIAFYSLGETAPSSKATELSSQ